MSLATFQGSLYGGLYVKRYDAAIISAVVAHALAWAAAFWLVVGPAYRGESVTAVTPGDLAGEPIRVTATFTATFIEANGLSVLPLLLAPVLLTALAVLVAMLIRAGLVRRGALVLASAILLLGFCAVGSYSIGMFFLPAAIALGFSGIIGLRQSRHPFRPS